jgi:hypothetical protein
MKEEPRATSHEEASPKKGKLTLLLALSGEKGSDKRLDHNGANRNRTLSGFPLSTILYGSATNLEEICSVPDYCRAIPLPNPSTCFLIFDGCGVDA